MLILGIRNLLRRPLRTALTVAGLALAIAVLACLSSFGRGYQRGLRAELDQMGLQMMLVPLGCPFDAAARVLKGKSLENSLPESALQAARFDPAVAVAAPLLMVALAAGEQGRADMWVGLDESARLLKPWWRAKAGESWFTGPESVILGADAAELETRSPGDAFYSPETGQQLRVAGILERSGTSDDSLFFVPLKTAQRMFNQPGRLTAIAIRLRDPAQMREATQRLQSIPGAQVVTLTEMLGTFLNLVGTVRSLLVATAFVAIAVSALTILNTLLAAVVERANELSIMRALGASRRQIMGLMAIESLLLSGVGTLAGLLVALVAGHWIENLVRQTVPLAPNHVLFTPAWAPFLECVAVGVGVGVLGGWLPAWRAAQVSPVEALKAE